MVPFAGLLAALEQIPDPRRRQGRRYPPAPPAAVLGAGGPRGRHLLPWPAGVHGRASRAPERGVRHQLRRAPAVNTLRALFQALDPAALEAAFRQHARELSVARTPTRTPCHRAGRQNAQAQLRPSERPGGGARAQRVRLRGGVDPGAPRGPWRARGDPGRAGADRGARRARDPVHRRCPARPEKTFATRRAPATPFWSGSRPTSPACTMPS